MKLPNFFIVGAPKCGTTALAEYLREHPQIFMSDPKEPAYFCKDFANMRYAESMSDYRRLFQDAEQTHVAVGEASPLELTSEVALPAIRAFNPDARIIAMLRNPVDLFVSWHSQLLFSFYEDVDDPEAAWNLQDERRHGRSIPSTCSQPELLDYSRICRLGEQVDRLMSVFPADQVKFVLLDDMRSSSRDVYREIIDFLGVPDDGRNEFPRVNEAKTIRYRNVARLMAYAARNPHTRYLMRGLKRLNIRSIEWLRKLYRRNAVRREKSVVLRPQFRQQLLAEFQQDISLLSQIIGRDVTMWR